MRHRLEHLGQIPPVLAASACTPQACSNRARTPASLVQSWNPTRRFGMAPMSPPPCTLFCPRSGFTPDPYLPDVPVSRARLISDEDVVHRVVVLGDAERPADHRAVGARIGVRRLANHVGRHAGLPLARTRACRARRRPGTPRSRWSPAG